MPSFWSAKASVSMMANLPSATVTCAGAAAGRAAPGVYHGTAQGQTSWFGLARAVFAEAGLDPARVRPTTSDRFPRPARRPTYSVLGHDHWIGTGVPPLPNWRAMLTTAMPSLLKEGT